MRDRLALALLLAVMAVCHLPSLLIFSAIFAAYALYIDRSRATFRARRAIATAAAGMLALGFASFYVLPALAEIDHVRMREMTSGLLRLPSTLRLARHSGSTTAGASADRFQVRTIRCRFRSDACSG